MAGSTTAQGQGPVAWDVAEQVARRLVRSAPIIDRETLKRLDDDFHAATIEGERLVEQVTGLRSTAGEATERVVDRAEWIGANAESFERLLSPLTEQFEPDGEHADRSPGVAGRAVAGAEIGVVLAWMSKRVLGQYDVMSLGAGPKTEAGGDVVYYVGPNIVTLERRHGFPQKEFRLWIAVHELTHRAQFTAVPWLREYFLDLVGRGLRVATPDANSFSEVVNRLISDLREGNNPIAQGGIVSVFASKEQLEIVREAQAFMSLLEGHGNYVMNRASEGRILGAPRFARVLSERRASASGVARLIQQLLGIEAKLRQYAEGESFIDAVVRVGGDELLSRVWEGPEMLPVLDEIRTPRLWIERVGESAASIA